MTITAAADGSALGNPGPAGWAWYIDETTWRAGGWPHGTNNMGELKAVLDLLEATAPDADQHLHILCDSQYVINAVTKWMPGWKRKGWRKKDGKPVLNVELLQAIDRALQGRSVEFEWVKGHAGHAMNEAADRRANAAATAFSKQQDPAVGPGYRPAAAPRTPAAGSTAAPAPEDAAPAAEDLLSLLEQSAPAAEQGAPAVPDACGAPEAVYPGEELGTELEQVIAHEQALLSERLRRDPPSAAALLHPEFEEIGASGRRWSREEVLEQMAPMPGVQAEDFVAEEIAPGTVLLRFTTVEPERTVLRSSLWQRSGDRWQLRHHQGTPSGGASRRDGGR